MYVENEMLMEEMLHFLHNMIKTIDMSPRNTCVLEMVEMFHFEELFQIMLHNVKRRKSKRYFSVIRNLQNEFFEVMNNKRNVIVGSDDTSLEVKLNDRE